MSNDVELRKLQQTELEILKEIDSFCGEKGIHYSLYDGTLLGAVRHQGFIPWDDDIDICMERSEYERFIQEWEKEAPKGLLLQNKENTPAFTQSFTKIRKEHTTFLQDERERGKYHTGIFVDVFPIDHMPSEKIQKLFYLWDCMNYQLLTREFVPNSGNTLVKTVSRAVLAVTPKEKRKTQRDRLFNRILKRSRKSDPMVGIETVEWARIPLPSDLMDEYIEVPFEGQNFMCVAKWDELLRRHMGDYMTLPPESERTWKHHPIILDFEHDLEELEHE